MSVVERLSQRRAEILARWRELIVESGARSDERLRPRGEDPFHDPVGSTLARATAAFVDGLSGVGPEGQAAALLAEVVRIAAVQQLEASRTVGFVFLLRRAVHEVLGRDLDAEAAEDRHQLERRIDGIALEAFDVLVGCREKLAELRAREALSNAYLLLRRAGLLTEPTGEDRAAGGEPR
jgi:hypothetical protein